MILFCGRDLGFSHPYEEPILKKVHYLMPQFCLGLNTLKSAEKLQLWIFLAEHNKRYQNRF